MSATSQRRLAMLAALAALTVVVAANVQLLTVAFRSQPACVVDYGAAPPAKRAC